MMIFFSIDLQSYKDSTFSFTRLLIHLLAGVFGCFLNRPEVDETAVFFEPELRVTGSGTYKAGLVP